VRDGHTVDRIGLTIQTTPSPLAFAGVKTTIVRASRELLPISHRQDNNDLDPAFTPRR